MLRFIFWVLIIYLIYRLFKNMFSGDVESGGQNKKNSSGIHGQSAVNPPLDLSNMDVEDAHYVDIDAAKKRKD